MSGYSKPTLQVYVKCGCPRPRKPPLHVVAETVAILRRALQRLAVLDLTVHPELSAIQREIIEALAPGVPFATWRCTRCQTVVEITTDDVFLSINPAS